MLQVDVRKTLECLGGMTTLNGVSRAL